MRDAFFQELTGLFGDNPQIVFMTGDLGYKLFDPLKAIDPQRVINAGIREAGMIGLASGMAKTGMMPIVYSITPFLTLRCLEQIKIDLCYNKACVLLVGVGGGFAYGPNGPTHHGIDDIGVLSCLPGMTIWTPADPLEVRACLRAIFDLEGPAYLRLGRNKEPKIHAPQDRIEITQPVVLHRGNDGIIMVCGCIAEEVQKAVAILKQDGISPTVIQLITLRPFPEEFLRHLIADRKPVMTVEEHISIGGLGMEAAKILAEMGTGNPFRMLSSPAKFPVCCMERDALLKWAGLNAEAIVENFRQLLQKKTH